MDRGHKYSSCEPNPSGRKPDRGVKGSATPLNPMGAPVPGYSATPCQTPSESPAAPTNVDYGPNSKGR